MGGDDGGGEGGAGGGVVGGRRVGWDGFVGRGRSDGSDGTGAIFDGDGRRDFFRIGAIFKISAGCRSWRLASSRMKLDVSVIFLLVT